MSSGCHTVLVMKVGFTSSNTMIGRLPEFAPENDTTSTFVERVQLLLETNEVMENKHVVVLLSTTCGKTHPIMCSLLVNKRHDKLVALAVAIDTTCKGPEPYSCIYTYRLQS